MWKGDAIRCNDTNDEIVFRQAQFLANDGLIKVCNSGAVKGQTVSVVDNEYMSRLSVNLTSELIGKNIACINSTVTLEEIISAMFTGMVSL